jgi:hypothetical protein
MQEPSEEGLANRLDPKACVGGREAAGEALTGVHAGSPVFKFVQGGSAVSLEGPQGVASWRRREKRKKKRASSVSTA